MLEDVMHHPEEQIQIEEISSPLSAQILEFCGSELFQETLQNPEVASSSNCYYEDHSSYVNNLPFNSQEINNILCSDTTTIATTTSPMTSATNNDNNTNNLSIIFVTSEDIDNDLSASDFSPSPQFSTHRFLNGQKEKFDISLLHNQMGINDDATLSQYVSNPIVVQPILGPPLSALHEDCLSAMPPSCSLFHDPQTNSYMHSNINVALGNESCGIFSGNTFCGNDMLIQEFDHQQESGGIFCMEPLPPVYNSHNKVLSNESQHIANGAINSMTTSLESDSKFKARKLSIEERKEKIHRYMKKRNERNFSKKIKYACRKTLADNRPRVRGRFAKSDEFGEAARNNCQNEEDTYNEIHVMVKEEEDMIDSSDIFSQISGMNSLCNFQIQSWI